MDWPHSGVQDIWDHLEQAVFKGWNHVGVEDEEGKNMFTNHHDDNWGRKHGDIGLDRTFYEVAPALQPVPQIIAVWCRHYHPDGWDGKSSRKICEHTAREQFYEVQDSLGKTVDVTGGGRDLTKELDTYYAIDKHVSTIHSIMEHEGVVRDKLNKGYSLALNRQRL